MVHTVNNKTYGKPHKAVKLAHPFRVALCKVIVYRYNVNALARECVQVCGECGDKGFALARLHLGDTSLMKYNSA